MSRDLFYTKPARTLEEFKEGVRSIWYCKKCHKPAKEEHEKEECPKCQNGGNCHKECTLSRVLCLKCSAEYTL